MRAVVKFLLTIIVVLVIAWLGLWWYAQGRLQSGFVAYAQKQAARGYQITYASLHRGTNPLRAVLIVDQPNFSGADPQSGFTFNMTVPSLQLRIEALDPFKVHLDGISQVTINAANATNVVINFGRLTAFDQLDPNAWFDKTKYPFKGGDVAASNIDVVASSIQILHIDSLTSHSDINLQAGANGHAFDGIMNVGGIALSPLMSRIASIPFDGKINKFGFTIDLSGPVPPDIASLPDKIRAAQQSGDKTQMRKLSVGMVHDWASGGGNGDIGITLAVGPSTMNAAAAVKFDANLQPEGTASLLFDHLDQFTAAIANAYPQTQAQIAQAEAQLTPYITNTDQSGQSLTMHITYGAGTVSINGNKVTDLPPINWTAAANPPPAAPAQ